MLACSFSTQMVRKNFLLVYELLDEIIDYGLPQNSSTERLKQFIMMEPVAVKQRLGVSLGRLCGGGGRRGCYGIAG